MDGSGIKYQSTDYNSNKWGILKVHGETTGSVSGSTFTTASAQSNYGEIMVGGTTIIPEDIASARYVYGIRLAETGSVTFNVRFPIFKDNVTGQVYGTSGSRWGSLATEMTLMMYGSGSTISSRADSMWCYNWRSRFFYSSRTVSQSSAATATVFGADPGYDAWMTVGTTMGGSGPGTGISASNGFLEIPITFFPLDGRKYSLYVAAEMKVVKFEYK